jgi:biotin carboxyl carrier protein
VVVRLGDREYKVVLKSVSPDTFEGRINDKPITVRIEKETGSSITITVNGERIAFERSTYRPEKGVDAQVVAVPKTSDSLLSPMPGRVVTVKVKKGQRVAPGDPLMTIESMKMETLLTCDRDATIAEVRVEEGEVIQRGQTLLVYSK